MSILAIVRFVRTAKRIFLTRRFFKMAKWQVVMLAKSGGAGCPASGGLGLLRGRKMLARFRGGGRPPLSLSAKPPSFHR